MLLLANSFSKLQKLWTFCMLCYVFVVLIFDYIAVVIFETKHSLFFFYNMYVYLFILLLNRLQSIYLQNSFFFSEI
jgi:hypothetical protein